MSNFTQANRLIAISTILGDDVMLLKGFELTHELGRPFTCELELRSLEHDPDFDKIIGSPATIRVQQTDGKTRFISGIIARIGQVGPSSPKRMNSYRALMVPGLWFLSRRTDYRIFQKMTVPDLVKKLVGEFGVEIKVQTTGTYVPRDYTTQYGETTLDFIHRLMEDEGIYYYFTHDKSSHTMVLVDSCASLNAAEGYADIPYVEQDSKSVGVERIFAWEKEKGVLPYQVRLRDFDYRKPDALLESDRKSVAKQNFNQVLEWYHYHSFFNESSSSKAAGGEDYTAMISEAAAKQLAQIRMEEIDCRRDSCRAAADTRGLFTGARFKLAGHPVQSNNGEYIVVGSHCSASTAEYSATDKSGGASPSPEEEMYQMSFSAIKAATEFRPARSTPRPRVPGPQTALVVGTGGKEIDPDMDGRVKVQFPWDREGKGDAKSSCWIRVSQIWAGAKFGALFTPRIGQEVVVEFIDGDPDKPLITGRVYSKNGGATVPYKANELPTISTIKSSTSTGGGGFNEIRFDDKKGEEQVFIHAEKQMDVRVKKDSYETIGNDRHLIIGNDQIEHVKHDRSEIVDNDHKEEVKNDRNLKIGGKEAVEIAKSKSLKVGGDVIEEFAKNQSTVVTGDHYLKAKNIVIEALENITLKVTDDSFIAIEKDSITIKTKAFDLTATEKGIDIKAMKDITVKSDTAGFSLKTTKAIDLDATTDVNVKAKVNANVEATAKLSLKGTAGAELTGAKVDVQGQAMATLKGGIVMIN